jgi:SNF2 family DNA or RNA helicase
MIYASPLLPRAHQVECLEKMRGHKEFAILAEFGVGKSKMLLDNFGELEAAGEVDDLLIIAPAGCYSNWVEDKSEGQVAEIKKNFSQDLVNRTIVGHYWSGMGKGAWEGLTWMLNCTNRPRVLVVNVEALSRSGAARVLCYEFLSHGRAMMAIDESTAIKGYNSERTKAVVSLGLLALYRRILTGMVTPNSPMDLYSQFEFLNWRILGQRSFYGFRARYAVLKRMNFGGRTARVVVGYRNEAELAERIAPHSFRCTKDECLDLPPKVYVTRDVEMTREQARVYREMRGQACSRLEDGHWVSAQMALTLMTRLHQVLCGHVRDDNGHIRRVESNRLEILFNTLGEISGKVIIWACYDYSILEITNELCKEFGGDSVARFWGGNASTRAEEERRWLGDAKRRFMVATPASGGRGNTWTVAQDEIYYSNSYSLEHRLNSEDRAHRIGQTKSVTITDLVCWDTVDEKILRALRKKIDLATVVNRDNFRDWVI